MDPFDDPNFGIFLISPVQRGPSRPVRVVQASRRIISKWVPSVTGPGRSTELAELRRKAHNVEAHKKAIETHL
jgi:hypothetical protein